MEPSTTPTSGDQAAQQIADAAPTAAPAAANPTAPAAPAPATGTTQGEDENASEASQSPAPGAAPSTAPPAAQPPSGIAGIMGSVLDLLQNRDTSTVSRDANGNRQVQAGAPLTRGQQIAEIALTALKGATTAAAAKPGPGHTGAGVSAAVQQAIGDQQAASHAKEENSNNNFAIEQKAKLDNINYQLLTRKNTAAEFNLKQLGVKGTQDAIDFAQRMEDREVLLKSYDLGTYADERQIPGVMAKQPEFMQKLYKEQGIIKIPIYGADGSRQGLHIYERKTDPGAQMAPEGTQAHIFTRDKPGEPPTIKPFTPVGPSNADIDRMNLKAEEQFQTYQKAQSDLQLHASEVVKNVAEAHEAGARSVEAIANAGKANAEARKARIDADNQGGTAGAMGTPQQLGQMMTDGIAAPSQLSKRSKDYNAALPFANAYSIQKYGVPFDAEIAEGRYKARSKTIESFGDGKEGDQIQTFNQFLGHAGQLSGEIDKLRNQNVSMLNVPINSLKKKLGATQFAAIEPLISATRTEHANFLNNNHALHEADISEAHDMLDDNMNLGQMQGAIKAFAGTAVVRTGALNERYKRVVGVGDVPGILDPNSRQVIKSLGLDKEATQHLGSAWTQPTQTQQNASTPPTPQRPQQQPVQQQQPPQAAPPTTHVFSPSAWLKANPQGDVNAAINAAKAQKYTVTQ